MTIAEHAATAQPLLAGGATPTTDANDPRAVRLAGRAVRAFAVAFFAAALLVALTVPYHATDALIFGEWSRRIGLTGGFHFPTLDAAYYQKPLFLVTQGWLWRIFGFHEAIGRVLSLSFAVLLAFSLVRLAGTRGKESLTAVVAVALLLAVPDFAQFAFAGMTDVPAAALAGATAVALWRAPARWWRPVLVAGLAAATVLARSSAPPALIGLAAASLLGPREGLRRRFMDGVLPIAAGGLLALAYEISQAHHVGTSLPHFLTAGALSIGAPRNDTARSEALLGGGWLGPYLRVVLIFTVAYSLARAWRSSHRAAASVAAPAAALGSWLLPWLGSGFERVTVGPLDTAQPAAAAATILLLVPLFLARSCPEDLAPSRAYVRRMLVWFAPAFLAWSVIAPYNTRYLSPGWAPLLLLAAGAMVTVVRGAARRRAVLGAAVLLVVAGAGLANLRNFDGLGNAPDGSSISAMRAVRAVSLGDLGHPDRMRRAADPELSSMLESVRRVAGPAGQALTNDGRLRFFLLDRVTRAQPRRCADLSRYRAFLLVHDGRVQGNTGRAALPWQEPGYWRRCATPRAIAVAGVPADYTVFRVVPGG